MEMILYNKLERIETNHTFSFLSTIIEDSLDSFYYISYTLITLLSNKDTIMIYISIIYVVSHPFVALKFVLTTNIIYYAMTIMKCIYQFKRPFWLTVNSNRFCYSSFANPSSSFCLVSFFLLYTIVSLNLLKTNNYKMTWTIKSIFILAYLILIFISGMIFVINRLNFIYQIIFTLCISLIIVCVLIDFESSIHNMIINSMKNIFRHENIKLRYFFIFSHYQLFLLSYTSLLFLIILTLLKKVYQ